MAKDGYHIHNDDHKEKPPSKKKHVVNEVQIEDTSTHDLLL
jgi:hypothetical protein